MEHPDKIYVTGRYVHYANSVFSLTEDGERTVLAKDSAEAVEYTRSDLVTELADALEWIDKIASVNYEQDEKLRSQGARTLIRISDKAREALTKVGR